MRRSICYPTCEYVQTTVVSELTEHADSIHGEAEEVLLLWQSLVAGTTRTHPLTGKPMFSHSIFGRCIVENMYEYDLDMAISVAGVCGVIGFAPHFFGIPNNNNQVE